MTINGSVTQPSSAGSFYSRNWRTTLAGVVQYGLMMYNFQTAPNAMLSYNTKIVTIDTSHAIINLFLNGSNSAMIYIAFSAVVITANTNYLELMSLSHYNTSNLYGVPTKFTVGSSAVNIHHFVEWITFDNSNYAGQHNNYFAYFTLVEFPQNNTLMVNFSIVSYP